MEELLSIQKYAARNRLSIHHVIKKTMTGELKTVTKSKNGQEITYIIVGENESVSEENNPLASTDESNEENVTIDYQKEYEALHKKYLILKTKYDKLLESSTANKI